MPGPRDGGRASLGDCIAAQRKVSTRESLSHCTSRLTTQTAAELPRQKQPGTVAKLFPHRDRWDVVIRILMTELAVWCDVAQDYVKVRDPERVILIPWAQSGGRFG
jgi:hypothetical protein